MTIDQIQRHLSAAAADELAPPTRVTAIDVYRAGLRRRRVRRWTSVAVATVAVAGAAGAATTVVAQETTRAPLSPAAPGASEAPGAPDESTAAVWRTCAELADQVWGRAGAALPAGVRWERRELPPGQETADCANGGLSWYTVSYRGQELRLGFEGGTGITESACDPERRPARCEQISGGEIGYLEGPDEYGVLYQRDRGDLYFFLGVPAGGSGLPLTTDEFATAAKRIADLAFT